MDARGEPDPPRFKVPVEGPPVVRMVGILESVSAAAQEVRAAHRLTTGWYVTFPQWVVARAGGWDAFCAEFEASHARTGLHHAGVIGFEVTATWVFEPPGGTRVTSPYRRYTVKRYREQETPE